MSEIFATQLTAVANVVLAVFAIVTAVLAGLAFREQSRAVSDQAAMLELQRIQLKEQQDASAKQAEVLELQAEELRESLKERKRETERQRREQAALVFLTEKPLPGRKGSDGLGPKAPNLAVTVVNSSNQPIYDVELLWDTNPRAHVEPSPDGPVEPNREHLSVLLPGDHAQRTRT